jgi:hypothetical protein
MQIFRMRLLGRRLTVLAIAFGLSLALLCAAGNVAVARATPKAKCARGNPNVYLNPTTKRYVVDQAWSSAIIQKSGAMGNVKSTCQSRAKAMGAHAMNAVQLKRMGHP